MYFVNESTRPRIGGEEGGSQANGLVPFLDSKSKREPKSRIYRFWLEEETRSVHGCPAQLAALWLGSWIKHASFIISILTKNDITLNFNVFI